MIFSTNPINKFLIIDVTFYLYVLQYITYFNFLLIFVHNVLLISPINVIIHDANIPRKIQINIVDNGNLYMYAICSKSAMKY